MNFRKKERKKEGPLTLVFYHAGGLSLSADFPRAYRIPAACFAS